MKYVILLAVTLCIPLPTPAQDDPKPATVQQIKDAIDWSKVPKLDGATRLHTHFHHITYQAPGTFLQAAEFFRKELPTLGWQEYKSGHPEDQKTYLSLLMEKGGMLLSVSGFRSKPADPMNVTLMIYGNIDVSRFPKVVDAEVKTNQKNAVYYFSKKSTVEVTSFLKKFMTERGWKEIPNDSAAMWAKEGRFVLTFHQNAMECVLVAIKQPTHVEVTYSATVRYELSPEEVTTTITGKDQATPASIDDATKVIDIRKLPPMEKATPAKNKKVIIAFPTSTTYEVPDSVDAAARFYRKLLQDQSWTELAPMSESDQLAMLYFEKAGYLLALTARRDSPDGNTSVALLNHGNVDLRKLPFPPGAKFTPSRSEFLNTHTTLTLDDAMDFYSKELPKLGWKVVRRGQWLLKFTQNNVNLDIEIQIDVNKKTSVKLRTGMK